MQIQDKPSFDTPYEWIGGEARVHALVERFYDLMELEPGYAQLRAVHPATLDNARHMPQSIGGHTIGIKERDQWLACMDQAMGETGVPEDLRERLRDSFFKTADWMRNRGA